MKLLIKQRVFSWTDTYDVYDENEMPKYFVKSDFFPLGIGYVFLTQGSAKWA